MWEGSNTGYNVAGGGGIATAAPTVTTASATSSTSTTSTTLVDLDSMSVTFTPAAAETYLFFFDSHASGTANTTFYMLVIDDVNTREMSHNDSVYDPPNMVFNGTLTAAAHTLKMQWKVSAGTSATLSEAIAERTRRIIVSRWVT